jgi:hypothetical protein
MKTSLEERWHEISPYLDQMLDLDSDARLGWVTSLEECVPDIAAQLRACLLDLAELDRQNFLENAVEELLTCFEDSKVAVAAVTTDPERQESSTSLTSKHEQRWQ